MQRLQRIRDDFRSRSDVIDMVQGAPPMTDRADQLRDQIRSLVAEYYTVAFPPKTFVPGESAVPVSGRVFDETDIQHLVDASLDFWLTTGRFAEQFERRFA